MNSRLLSARISILLLVLLAGAPQLLRAESSDPAAMEWGWEEAGRGTMITVDLGGIPNGQPCPFAFELGFINMEIVETTTEDHPYCQGICSYSGKPDGVELHPARLVMDLSELDCPVTKAEVDVLSGCDGGCSRAFLYKGGIPVDIAYNTISDFETLILDIGDDPADTLALSSCEARFFRVRLFCFCTDQDKDGYSPEGDECGDIDCDDSDSTTYPDALELCDGKDNDCDGTIDEECMSCPARIVPVASAPAALYLVPVLAFVFLAGQFFRRMSS